MRNVLKALVITCLSASPVVAFEAQNKVTVNPMSGGLFEVIEGGSFGARSTWCAAGDYATVALGAKGRDRIYVVEPRGPSRTEPGRKGVVFSTNGLASDAGGATVISQLLRTPGSSIPVHHARGFCRDDRLIRSN